MTYEIIIGRGEEDRKKYGLKGTVLLGKHYVKMGQITSLSNPIYMDVTRSHVVFICGKRGGGKCLDGSTLIALNDGSRVPISQLEHDDRDILSLNSDLKICTAPKSDFFKRSVDQILYIRLRSGKEIKLTPEHPLLTVDGWTPANELPTGSRIATPRRIPVHGESSLKEHEIKLLAYLIAEGHLGNNFVLFSNNDEMIVNDFKRSVNDFDALLVINSHGKEGCYRVSNRSKRMILKTKRDSSGRFAEGISFSKNSLKHWVEKFGLYNKLSKEKFIPEKVFRLPKKDIALFLNRYFSCDGTIYFDKCKRSWIVSVSSTSKDIIDGIHHLLLRFEILSSIRKKVSILGGRSFSSFELSVQSANISRFLQEIGFFGIKEQKQALALKESEKIRNPNLDTVPKEIWDSYRPQSWVKVGKEIGYSNPKSARSSIDYAPSRQKLLQIAEIDNAPQMRLLAESDIFWDEIIESTVLKGEFTVYDISVPDNHNFIANDIIVHNSYTMGVIAEGMSDLPPEIKDNIAVVMLDTMGIYWTMKYPNEKEKDLLDDWKLTAKPLAIQIYTPYGYFKKYKEQGIPTDFPFAIKPSELSPSDWALTFDTDLLSPVGVLIERIVAKFRERNINFDLDDVIKEIRADKITPQHVKDAAENRFMAAKTWGLFSKDGTPLSELVKGGQVTVLDVSCYVVTPGAEGIRALVIGLVSQKLFIERMIARKGEEFDMIKEKTRITEEGVKKQEVPLVWLVVDEAHEFIPKDYKTAASGALITILREGRQPGISLILATQQPGKIHTDVMTQSDILISHRLTAKVDIEALKMLMQSYMREGLDVAIDNLPRVTGSALIFDDSNERMYPMRVRPRFTWHGGSAPTAIKDEKKLF